MKHGFELVRDQEIPELNSRAFIYRHVKTGAELLSIENDDENKVFGIVFRTPPPDSTGLPHIMEHSVLCGSRKYPVKEPFVELLKGSLNTFLNAMTSPDKTSYPVASQNVKDLYNLIDVYLDAVFYPRITPQILQQEGWHYELEAIDGPLAFKGVVFNEMKGAYSSPDNLLYRQSRMSLFGDTPYGLDSGGDPTEIPNLTFEQFRTFHQTYYHPSNARIFFYGDDDPEERLRLLDAYLREFEPLAVDSMIPLQAHRERPLRLVVPYDAGEEASTGGKKGMLTVNWLLPEKDDPETMLGLEILDHILIGTQASPLRKALIDSGLGEDLVGGGVNDGLRQVYFSTGLKGIAAADAERVEQLIDQTLDHLVREGIDPEMIQASLNTVEFQLRENNTGRFPRGLALMFRALSTWLYGGDPLAPLAFESPMQSIQRRVAAQEAYFENMIARYLIDNTHRTTVLLQPDPNVRQEQEAAERARLDAARAAMSEAELQQVIEQTRELKRIQETPDSPEALATIPSLTIADLDPKQKEIPLQVTETAGCPTLYHDLFTNGIIYLDLAFDLHALPPELVPLVSLFGQSLVKMGTESEDYVKLSQRIGLKTGGIGPTTLTSAVNGSPEAAARLVVRAKATMAHAGDLVDILKDILLTVKLDNRERFKQMVLENKAGQEAGLVPGGHAVVQGRLDAQFNQAGWAAEQIGGLEQLFFLRRLAEEVEQDWPVVLSRLEQVREILINRRLLICNVTLDAPNWEQFQPHLAELVGALPNPPTSPAAWPASSAPVNEGLTIPARVNYVAKGTDLYAQGFKLHGSIMPIIHYLRTTWLWERVRVQGGAYGGGCAFDRQSGLFSYWSYRDPNLLATLEVYDQTSQFLRNLDLSDDELAKSIIGTIGRIDQYQLPDAKGYTSFFRYLIGDTQVSLQQLRDEVLGTRHADFQALSDVLARVAEAGQIVVMGSQEAIAQANATRGGLHVVNVL